MAENQINIIQLKKGDNFSYIAYDPESSEAVCVDPSNQTEKILSALKDKNLKLRFIFLTHHHYDHTGGTIDLKDETGASIVIHYREEDSQQADIRVRGNEILKTESFNIKVIHTPGHTRGSICIHIENNLFTGDTLFVGYVGRTDLPGGSTRDLFKSIQFLKFLPENTRIFPGHDYGKKANSDLADELKSSPFMNAEDVKELSNLMRTVN